MTVIPRIDPNTDRVGWRYRSKRRGRVWIVTSGSTWGWHMLPDWPGGSVSNGGGTKGLFRNDADLDDTRKWERVDA